MAFSSPLFLLVFLPVVLGLFLIACGRRPMLAVAVLPAATVAFCLATDPRALAFLAASLLGNHLVMRLMLRWPPDAAVRRGLLAAGILFNLAPLALLKLGNLQALGVVGYLGGDGSGGAVLPLGLAFYTLQQITFLLDAPRLGSAGPGPLRYVAWGSLFCQLPAGPIAPYAAMAPQYQRLGHERPPARMILAGLTLFLFGLLKKILIADTMGRAVDPLYAAAEAGTIATPAAWAAAWGFALQLYFDFSAYSDMAIGLAMCFGLRLPVNFDSPLKARSAGDYVMRWHMSLMRFARDYVFQPVFRIMMRLPLPALSRTRHSVLAWAAATMATFIAIALWHSPAPIIILQGIIGAAIVILLQIRRAGRTATRVNGGAPAVMTRIRGLGGQVLTLVVVSLTVMCLRAGSLDGIGNLMTSLFRPDPGPIGAGLLLKLAIASLIALAAPNSMRIFGLIEGRGRPPLRWRWQPDRRWGWATGIAIILLAVLLTRDAGQQEFIYARF
ncbi:MBOAT family O-acyltransferase [uncultured Tistrella sp.]|uniref:MBOAT family O-acyltransferase n=1 Tax=Tistrella mobilis TaxID=171437 RepID=UPI000C09C80D|nr:MBOAT family O-acyltransferase [uncultured Tistrella sp.]MAM76871.1 hypothetical protein [Tistrella sp.]